MGAPARRGLVGGKAVPGYLPALPLTSRTSPPRTKDLDRDGGPRGEPDAEARPCPGGTRGLGETGPCEATKGGPLAEIGRGPPPGGDRTIMRSL